MNRAEIDALIQNPERFISTPAQGKALAEQLLDAMMFVRSIAALNDGLSDGDRALVFTKLTSRARRILSRWEAP